MTGYPSKRNMAQAKLTVDRAQVEQWMEALKDIDALHHPADAESVDAQKAIADMGQALAQPARPWVGLTDEETSGFTPHEMAVVKYVSKVLQEKNNGT